MGRAFLVTKTIWEKTVAVVRGHLELGSLKCIYAE